MVQIVRLLAIPHHSIEENFVEIDGPNGPGLICTNYLRYQPLAANVICKSERELFAVYVHPGNASFYYSSVRYGASFNCTGQEASIDECKVTVFPMDNCRKDSGEAILQCSTGKEWNL